MTRHQFFEKLGLVTCTLFYLVVNGCKGKVPQQATFSSCDDFTNVPESDQQLRASLAYADASPIEENTCGNCNLWLPPQGDVPCGGCTLFAGPVATEGHCTYWAPQVKEDLISN